MVEITRIKFFWALLPDKNFYARVINDKDRARKLVGEQLYLSDPPHLTLYVADFADSESLPAVTEEIARGIGKAPTVTITAWHVFYHDNLTGKTTLVYEISTDGSAALRSAQATAVCMASPYRDPYACRQRYDAVWEKLGDEEPQYTTIFFIAYLPPIERERRRHWRCVVTLLQAHELAL